MILRVDSLTDADSGIRYRVILKLRHFQSPGSELVTDCDSELILADALTLG